MSEAKANSNCFREAVCIETQRVFDSCCDKDCLEDLDVAFSESAQKIIESASFVKSKCAEIVNTYFTIEPVPFNKGFYSIDITYYFNIVLEAYTNTCTPPTTVSGCAQFTKKVILFGSEGSSKLFSSDDEHVNEPEGCCYQNLPTATVRAVEPIVLDSKLVTKSHHHKHPCCDCCPPPCDDSTVEAKPFPPFPTCQEKKVFVTLGLFSIVSLLRTVNIMVPVYEYCIPDKACPGNNGSPCELFEKINFPTDDFFPQSLEEMDTNSQSCGSCGTNVKR